MRISDGRLDDEALKHLHIMCAVRIIRERIGKVNFRDHGAPLMFCPFRCMTRSWAYLLCLWCVVLIANHSVGNVWAYDELQGELFIQFFFLCSFVSFLTHNYIFCIYSKCGRRRV